VRVLVVNAGSSSLKLRLLEDDDRLAASEDITAAGGRFDEDRLGRALGSLGPVDAVGHRIVHGGRDFRASVRIDAAVEARLRALTDLAPLHQPKSLAALDAVSAALPDAPAVACFDTAFHASLPEAAATYAVPAEWRTRYGARRYGFHGLSHAYAARRAAEILGRPPEALRLVTCHLGAGASCAAVLGGRSVDTTMGFTPLEGLVMATRAGSVDPGLVLWLQQVAGLDAAALAEALEHRSGILALAGTDDMRAVIAAAPAEPDAGLALAVYLHRLRAAIAAMTAALGGLDAVVFTGGVGENAPGIRAGALEGLGFLGLAIDPVRNAEPGDDADLSAGGARARCIVVRSREDLEIAREVRCTLASWDPGSDRRGRRTRHRTD